MLDGVAAILKALSYAALLSAAGAPLAAASLHPVPPVRDYAARVMRWAALALILVNLAAAAVLFLRLGGSFDEATLGAVFSSGPGAAFALQISGAVMLLLPPGDDEAHRGWRLSAAFVIAAFAMFNGHAAAVSPMAGLVAMAHVVTASWWIGSLWLLHYACNAIDRQELVKLVGRFGWLAVRIVGGLVAVGIVLIVTLLDFDAEPWMSDYTRSLAIKLVVVAFLLALAFYNRVRLTPILALEGGGRLRRTIAFELGLVGCILIATAVLTTYFAPEA